MTFTVKTPAKHALDWHSRTDFRAEIVSLTPRTMTLRLESDALADLISDSKYYAEEMGPDNTGDIDYRPAARRCFDSLSKVFEWDQRGSFNIYNVREKSL